MKKVYIHKLENDGSQSVLVTCSWEEGDKEVRVEGDSDVVSALKEHGVKGYLMGKEEDIFPCDGREFLEALKYNFKSGYYNATDIIEE